MNSFGILLSIGAEELLNYSTKDIIIVIGGLVALVKGAESFKNWLKQRKKENYEELDNETELKNTVSGDHERVVALEKQMLALNRCVKEIVKIDIMESHDRYMSRKPFPYITRYERLIHITMYDAYSAIDSDPAIDGFHKELLELTVRDDDGPSDAGDI